ncbi:MAG: glycosyltransferase family 9 protein [Candidatus Binataceae bacterium]
MRNAGRRVLVIFPGALGDLICLAPALRAISGANRGGSLELIARGELVKLALGRLGVDGGDSLDRREIAALFTGPGRAYDAARDLFRRYDRIHSFFAFDHEIFRRSLAHVSRADVSFHPFRPEGDGHISVRYLEAIGERSDVLENRIDLLDDDLSAAVRRLARMGIEPGRYAIIFPGSGGAAKNWPLDRFVALAGVLAGRLHPIFITGPAENAIEPILRRSGFAFLNRLELAEVAALAAMAAVFVGNDSGVSHLAAAAGAPGVAIFGPTDPAQWRPLGNAAVIRRQPLERLQVLEVAREAARQCRSSLAAKPANLIRGL